MSAPGTDERPSEAVDLPHEPGSGVRIGRLLGIPLYATVSWFVSAVILTVLIGPTFSLRVVGVDGVGGYAVAGAYVALLYLSVLAHELSHSVVARRLGLKVRRITLHLLGGQSELDEPPTPTSQAAVAIAGPAVSIAIGVAALLTYGLFEPNTITWALIYAIGVGNLIVGAFNLLPGLPLDGGQVLRAIVWAITGRANTGIRVAAQVGRVIAVGAVGGGILLSVTSRPMSVVSLIIGVLLAGFLWAGATQGLLTAQLRDRLATLTVRSLARRAIPVPAGLPLSEAVRQAQAARAGAIVVVDGDGRPQALVSEASVTSTPEHRWPWTSAADVSRTLQEGMRVDASLDGERMLQAMREHPASEYLVVESSGQIYGVLSSRDVERALATA